MRKSRFIELLNLYIDDEISPEESESLMREVRSNPERHRIYLEYCQINAACSALGSDFEPRPRKIGVRQTIYAVTGLAAAIALVGLAGRNVLPLISPAEDQIVVESEEIETPVAVPVVSQPVLVAAPVSHVPVVEEPTFVMAPSAPQIEERRVQGTIELADMGQLVVKEEKPAPPKTWRKGLLFRKSKGQVTTQHELQFTQGEPSVGLGQELHDPLHFIDAVGLENVDLLRSQKSGGLRWEAQDGILKETSVQGGVSNQ